MPSQISSPEKPAAKKKPLLLALLQEKKDIIDAVRAGKPASSVPPIAAKGNG